jgi:uncharacterized membrane protein
MSPVQAPSTHATNGHTPSHLAPNVPQRSKTLRTLLLSGVVVGLGLAGNLDQIVMHELLQWHVFYVHTAGFWQRFFDGVFHLSMVGVLVAGLVAVWTWQSRHPRVWRPGVLVAGVLLGVGAFNLFDGTVIHKLLRFHQVREGVADLWRYDLGYLGLALIVLMAGWGLWWWERRH